MKKVAVVGSAIMDVITRSSAFKVMKSHQVVGGVALCEVYGGKTELDDIKLVVGGAGTNVAVGLSKLGIVSASLVRIGDDPIGEMILNNLKLSGVETSMVQIEKGGTSGMSVVLVASDGGRSIMTYRGVSKSIESSQIDWEKLNTADWIQISSLGGNMDLLEDVVAFASREKIRIGLNPGRLEINNAERLVRLISKMELVVLNRMEAAMLMRHNYEDEMGICRKLASLGNRYVCVTDGKEGASLISGGRLIKMKAFRVKSVDDTGAGDAFCAGLVAGLLEERGVEVALKMGLSNGAGEVTKLGAKEGLLTKREMDRWLKKQLLTVEERI